ncbi:MAG: PAS domain-containing sensor histidine kinase, partial [Desulfobacterales bacterium]|nr:PAS domain-containing sensor histidine kinase [Desulfobacterales bacterium]
MKKNYLQSQQKDLRRRRRERYLIAVLLVVISFLTCLGVRVFNLGLELPFSSSILVFALININVILLLLLFFLTGRNLV